MNNPKPNITIPVDLTNPGQFFACCGLLELADRLWPGAEGWFEEKRFHLRFAGNISELFARAILDCPLELTHIQNLQVKRIIAPLKIILDGGALPPFILDFWVRVGKQNGQMQAIGNTPWNLWSGQQTPLGIWNQLRSALREIVPKLGSIDESVGIFNLMAPLTGRFGFDSSAAWNAQDLGFSPNIQSISVDSSPVTELLAAIGLQRFLPRRVAQGEMFAYAIWKVPASPMIAASASCGAVTLSDDNYEFAIISRGRYAAFKKATQIQGDLPHG
jgi:CRISPR-associated protein Csx14